MAKELDLGKDKIGRLFLKYAIPAILGMLVMSLYAIVDGIFIGRYVGADGLASLNIAMPVTTSFSAISVMITVGANTYVAIELGRENDKRASKIFSLGMCIQLVLGILISVIFLSFKNEIAMLLGASDKIINYVIEYLTYIAMFAFFFMSNLTLDFGLKSMGKVNYAVKGMIFSSILNIVLDYIFIAKLGLGVKGAAIATGIAQCAGFFVLVIPFLKNSSRIKITYPLKEISVLWRIIYNGSSELITQLSVAITTFLFNINLMNIEGVLGVSAYSIITYASVIIFAIIYGAAQATQPIISYNYGANNKERVRETLKLGIKTVTILGIISTLMMFLFSDNLVRLFVGDNERLLKIAVEGARIYGFSFIIIGVNVIISSYYTSTDEPRGSIIVSLCRSLIFVVIGLYTLTKIFGLTGVWMSIPFAELATLIYILVTFKEKDGVFIPSKEL